MINPVHICHVLNTINHAAEVGTACLLCQKAITALCFKVTTAIRRRR